MFKQMTEAGISPDVDTFNSVIDGLVKAQHFERALEILKQMTEAGISPDVDTLNSMIDGLVKAQDFAKESILREPWKYGNVQADDRSRKADGRSKNCCNF
eukprot:TRINITY_DN329_c1_g1_i6.p1 TRINITY_DN329_c1_g1~~TRINITY_DN329_c1_g1_i6.p1  ORF type:complete len:100 (+),score=34.72 TRINITY_DN329_c1_g1_i6:122-421(+)